MNRLRTAAYQIVFLVGSALIVLPVPLVALRGQAAMIRYAHGWSRFSRWCARALLGISARVEGAPIAGPALYASKHQSLFETTELEILLGGAAPVIKRELWRLPLWGWAVQVYGAIPVDREASAGALRSMLRDAKQLKSEGRSVVIYPEGTRVAPGEQPPLRAGFAGLYRALGYPVVPVAVDTGRLWPKRGAKRAGVVTIRFGDPIPPGLAREEVEARVHAAINVLEAPTLDPSAHPDCDHRTIKLIGGKDEEVAVLSLKEADRRCLLHCSYRGKVVEGEAFDFFGALCEVREQLAADGLMPFCYGASLNVYPSGMARDMGQGLRAYKYRLGEHATMTDLVDIFAEGPDVIPVSVALQEEHFRNWLASPRR